jgi:hypothetical protein
MGVLSQVVWCYVCGMKPHDRCGFLFHCRRIDNQSSVGVVLIVQTADSKVEELTRYVFDVKMT